jgi:lipooligosaccharide transport system permease protein
MTYALRAYEYWLLAYSRVWRGTIASSILNPVLYLTALGVGLGTVVNKGAHPLGVPYLTYVAPGLLGAVAMQVATIESAWPVHAAIRWTRQYFAMLATPLRVGDLIAGHLLYVATRAAMSGAIYLVVIAAFGAVRSSWALLAWPSTVLIGLAFGAPVSALSAYAEREPFNPLMRFGIMPMFLFSGTFFPVTQLPHVLRELAYATPLWHGVDLLRHFTLGTPTIGETLGHVAYLLLWVAVGVVLARLAHRKRLVL